MVNKEKVGGKRAVITQIASNNGKEDEGKEEEELPEIFIPPEALDSVILDLPGEYLDEVFADELLSNITAFHRASAARKAARHQEDHKKAEELSKVIAYARSYVALIQHEHPNTVALYKEYAEVKTKQVRDNRKRAREAQED